MTDEQIALMFHSDDAARIAAQIAQVDVILLDEDYSKKTGFYGFDPYTYEHDVMPLVAAISLTARRLEELRARGESLGEVGRATPTDLMGWNRTP